MPHMMASRSSVVICIMMKYYLLAILLLCMLHVRCSTAQVAGYIGKEKDVLVALKNSFNYPYLNTNWTGAPCFKSEPSTWYGIQCTGFNDIGRVTGIVLENMPLNRSIDIFAFTDLAELSVLTLKNNSLWGNMMDFSLNPKLTHINLSGNMFCGQISPSLLSLETLESLQLQDNGFSGPIPWLNQSTLKVFNASNNNVNGSIPMTQALQAFGYDSYSGNPGLCGKPSPIACNSSSIDDNPTTAESIDTTPKDTNNLSLYWFLFDAAGLVALVLLFILYYKKSHRLKKMLKEFEKTKSSASMINNKNNNNIDLEGKNDAGDEETKTNGHRELITRPNPVAQDHQTKRGKLVFVRPQHNSKGSVGNQMTDHQIFEMADLLKASAVGLGNGTFGNSYKAEVTTTNNAVAGGRQVKQAVVIKRLRDLKPLVNEEFTKPLQLIANLKHPNLLPLLAYYLSKDEKLLLYKYVPNGNLFNRMFGERGPDRIPFRWSSRLSVARGVAQALEYLHLNATSSAESSSSTAPHGNLKSSNVLLDENDGVLVSDYGFTSLVVLPVAAQRMVSYKSPEYKKTKKVSKESDVWSYGNLVLELLTGKISTCTAPPGVNGIDLSGWVHRAVREEWTAEIFDMELTVRRTACSGMLRLLQIAMRCCDPSPEKRPKMKEVVRELESIRLPQSAVDESEDLSLDPSLTDDSLSNTAAPARVSK